MPEQPRGLSCLAVAARGNDLDDAVYAHIDIFIEMMRDSNSYVRTRGLTLIACNALLALDSLQ